MSKKLESEKTHKKSKVYNAVKRVAVVFAAISNFLGLFSINTDLECILDVIASKYICLKICNVHMILQKTVCK